ncbi:MAG: CoA transferase [Chloroflexota bacterium]|nr:CoA transferase [Chloroflexota bacterium]
MEGILSGVTVVDLTRVLAGPYCTMILADLGARVIKVEAPGRGDDARHIGPFVGGTSAYFMSLNRGKESIALDLKDDGDRAIFEQLLDRADVLTENFRAGTMDRLGYGWEALHAKHPRLIYAATSGFGATGPYAHRPAYDMVVQAMGGIMSLTGHPGSPPTRVGTSIGDISAWLFTAIGISSALYRREQTGEGMMIDVAMLDCQVAILENAIARYASTGEVPGPIGSRHPSITPFEAYATEDGYIVIAAGNDQLFARLCETIGAPDLAHDPRFATNASRTEHCIELKLQLEQELAARPSSEWLLVFEAAGMPSGPIQNVAQVLSDLQVLARNMVVTADNPVDAPLRMAGNPIKVSGYADASTRTPAPELDADRARILTGGSARRGSIARLFAARPRATAGARCCRAGRQGGCGRARGARNQA